MNALFIAYKLRELGIRQTDVARACGVAKGTIYKVLRRQCKSSRIELYIANALNENVLNIFPDHKPRVNTTSSAEVQ
jgi:lambda repressor-like predicted transcriptional regulator